MNNFTVTINGHQYKNAVFPLKFGAFLDEQLDFATVTLSRVSVKHFKPTTPVFITITSKNTANGETFTQTRNLQFVIAADNARETPVGSGFYRHELSLIEPTKLLEIPMESLCFTNAGARDFATNATAPELVTTTS